MSDMTRIDRTVELDDLVVRAEGNRREIVAYAAVFDHPVEIEDHFGHYYEKIARSAFDVTLRDNPKGVKAIFNHGRDIYGNPSDRFAMPIGTPLEMRSDARGLLTVTRVSRTELGDEILELARDGALTAFSFSGRPLQKREEPAARSGDLKTVVRTEIALREFGPAVFAAYDTAAIVAVRSEPTPTDTPAPAPAPDPSETSFDRFDRWDFAKKLRGN